MSQLPGWLPEAEYDKARFDDYEYNKILLPEIGVAENKKYFSR